MHVRFRLLHHITGAVWVMQSLCTWAERCACECFVLRFLYLFLEAVDMGIGYWEVWCGVVGIVVSKAAVGRGGGWGRGSSG